MAISTNQKPTVYRNLYENMDPELIAHIRVIQESAVADNWIDEDGQTQHIDPMLGRRRRRRAIIGPALEIQINISIEDYIHKDLWS